MAESKPNDLSNDLESQFELVKSFESLSPAIALGTAAVRSLQNSGYEAYFAGGFGRNLLIGDTPKNVDIATSASSEAIMAVCLLKFKTG